VVGGNAAVSGEVVVSSLGGFHPSPGDAFGILRTSGTTRGNFDQLDETQFNTLPGTPRGQLIEVVAPNGIDLVYAKSTTPPATGPEPPPIVDVPEPLPPVISEPELVALVNPTAEELTSLYQIGFSAADMQRFNLGDRMFQIQQSVVPPPPVIPPPVPTGKEVEGKGVEGKAPPPAPPPSPINRWGVWAAGWGDFANVDSTSAAQGYRFVVGGVSAGVDYLVIPDHFAVGLFGGYSRSWINLTPSGSATANTGRGGLYATYFNQGWWVDAAGWAGGTNYSTSRQGVGGTANGETSGWEASTFGEAGKDFLCGNFTFGPVVAMQYTNVHLNGFGETGSLVPLNIHGDSQDSLVTALIWLTIRYNGQVLRDHYLSNSVIGTLS
jgi:Autotransporter beta-domain